MYNELKRKFKNLKDLYSLDLKTKNGKSLHFQSGVIPSNATVVSQSTFMIKGHNLNDLVAKIAKNFK